MTVSPFTLTCPMCGRPAEFTVRIVACHYEVGHFVCEVGAHTDHECPERDDIPEAA